jgi:hypothetical protein
MNSEMNNNKTQIIVAALALIGVLGGAIFSNWDKLFDQKTGPTPGPTVIVTPSPDPTPTIPDGNNSVLKPSPEINISGFWRDNWGNSSQVTQEGSAFTYTAWGAACNGVYFKSVGNGVIKGNTVESDYQSNFSQGHCSGTVSSDGRRMSTTCNDSVCKQFQSTGVRQ